MDEAGGEEGGKSSFALKKSSPTRTETLSPFPLPLAWAVGVGPYGWREREEIWAPCVGYVRTVWPVLRSHS